MDSLKTLGINVDIPITELLGENFNPYIHNMNKSQIRKVNALRDVMVSYNRQRSQILSTKPISTSKQAADVAQDMRSLEHEEVHMLFLNQANKMICKEKLSDGMMNACAIEIRDILSKALSKGTTSIILYHNHPSGSARPSESDIKYTSALKKACNTVGLTMLDHIVITQRSYYSFAEEIEILFS
jgi:DNA repair protein RadC